MYASDCQTRGVPRGAASRLLWVSLFFAAAILAATWLGTSASLPGAGAGVMIAASLLAGWVLNGRSRVRGLPLVAGVVMAVMALGEITLGTSGFAISGGAMFMALLLSAMARSWGTGLATIAILAAASLLSWLV